MHKHKLISITVLGLLLAMLLSQQVSALGKIVGTPGSSRSPDYLPAATILAPVYLALNPWQKIGAAKYAKLEQDRSMSLITTDSVEVIGTFQGWELIDQSEYSRQLLHFCKYEARGLKLPPIGSEVYIPITYHDSESAKGTFLGFSKNSVLLRVTHDNTDRLVRLYLKQMSELQCVTGEVYDLSILKGVVKRSPPARDQVVILTRSGNERHAIQNTQNLYVKRSKLWIPISMVVGAAVDLWFFGVLTR